MYTMKENHTYSPVSPSVPKLSLLGPFPPPFGGVALHLIRLMERLQTRGIDVRGISTAGLPKGLPHTFRLSVLTALAGNAVHMHTDEGNARRAIALGMLWKMVGRPYCITVHSFRLRKDLVHLDRTLAGVYRNARAVIAISKDVRDALQSRLGLTNSSLYVVPSALPISQWERDQSPPALPQQWKMARVRFLANAGRITRYDGEDLYGIDTLLTAFRELPMQDASLLIILGTIVDVEILNLYTALAGSDSRIHFVHNMQSPLSSIVHLAHCVVRPTRTEGGESLTLAEAIEEGTWAVGSDAVQRPPGTILFKTGSAADLLAKLTDVAATETRPTPKPADWHALDSLMQIYADSGFLRS